MVKELEQFNSVIQKCPDCGKNDAYKDDGHICDKDFQEQREKADEYYD
jgi:hypothetical protein